MHIDWTKFLLAAGAGYIITSLLMPRGWSTKKSDTNPWNISNIQGSMRSPPDSVMNRSGDPNYSPNPSHAPFPVLGPRFP